ncbi:conserved hypothetical protein [Theileria equi strain WA]|uniref:Uncharacterized protein n=1 Tax=Theileria equi strain WA TaxID=1537102 RepID=L1LCU2_THEEQ|nr:conserved hypothetical protein [Theileria equi strain WA]EKX72988.1 conserved hypothetical protein [Theileria equi strain WA]|eukprot:XP_004832440.1 conserved hypothetical protein [Theileria equi strain WA]
MSSTQVYEPEESRFAPDLNLFGDETDGEDDVYRADQFVGEVHPPQVPRRKTSKANLLSLGNFWSGNDKDPLEPKEPKNHLWDFLVYSNLRESYSGNYATGVRFLESELKVAINKTRAALLSEILDSDENAMSTSSVELAFDKYIVQVLKRLRILIYRDKTIFKSLHDSTPRHSSAVSVVEKFIESHPEVIKLRNKIYTFRESKNKLIKGALEPLLRSVDQLRTKMLAEMYDPSSPILKRFNITRFLKHMDKISSRADFFGEYRFHLLKTYFNNKDELDEYINTQVTFGISDDMVNDFSKFVNTFTPDLEEPFHETRDVVQESYEHASVDENLDEMYNFMNGTAPDHLIGTAEEPPVEEIITEPSVPEQPEEEKVAEDELKLLEEARRKAAEILRFVFQFHNTIYRLKRLQRMQSIESV